MTSYDHVTDDFEDGLQGTFHLDAAAAIHTEKHPCPPRS